MPIHDRDVLPGSWSAPVDLRAEREPDRAVVRRLHLAAFGEHRPLVAALVEALRDQVTADDGRSMVAIDDDRDVVGRVMFARALLDAPRRPLEVQVLSPAAVVPARQNHGIGTALVKAGLQVMTDRSVPV